MFDVTSRAPQWAFMFFCEIHKVSLPSAVFTLSLWALKTLSISVGAIVPSKPTGIPLPGYGTIGVVGVGGADDGPMGDCNCLISIFIRKSSAPAYKTMNFIFIVILL